VQARGHNHDHPAGELVPEIGIGFAAPAHGRGVKFEQLGRLAGHGPKLPLERREAQVARRGAIRGIGPNRAGCGALAVGKLGVR